MRPARVLPLLLLVGLCCGRLALAADGPALLQLDTDRSVDLQSFVASGGRCGTVDFGPAELPRAPGKGHLATTEGTIQIPVAFHVIYKEVTKSGKRVRVGDVSALQLDAQIRVLNAAYASAGIAFVQRSVDRYKSSTWYAMTMGSQAERDAKTALGIDPAHVLNIYTIGPTSNVLGWAYFPWSFPESNVMHGLVVLYSTLPGGSAAPYDEGDTATHEIGHYLGLYHTFQGGCSASGDYVTDTPAEATPAYGCPLGRNTCPAAGIDPIDNFMDYSDDDCMTKFTAGQSARIRWAVASYKRLLTSARLAAQGGEAPADGNVRPPTLEASPNPFNPTTTIVFRLDREAHVSLGIFDVAGREVASLVDAELPAGEHRVTFAARDLPSGVYLAVLRAGDARLHQRLVLLK